MSNRTRKGQNPFDRFVAVRRTSVAPPPPPQPEVEAEPTPKVATIEAAAVQPVAKPPPSSDGPVWARIQEARDLAAYQKARMSAVEEALKAPDKKELPVQGEGDTSSDFEVVEGVSTQDLNALRGGSRLNGHGIWHFIWFCIWAAGSLVAIKENALGGLGIAFIWFWPCMFCAMAPRLYSGLFGQGGRGNSGTAV